VPLHVPEAQLVPEQYWRTLLPMQVGLDALVQATQVPVVVSQTGVTPVQDVLTQLPALQRRLVVALEHSVVVPVQATHWPETQYGVAAGQAEVPLNAPLTQALRLLVSAHCETVVPHPLPSAAQV
jgi:hypothetical protein